MNKWSWLAVFPICAVALTTIGISAKVYFHQDISWLKVFLPVIICFGPAFVLIVFGVLLGICLGAYEGNELCQGILSIIFLIIIVIPGGYYLYCKKTDWVNKIPKNIDYSYLYDTGGCLSKDPDNFLKNKFREYGLLRPNPCVVGVTEYNNFFKKS